MGCHEQPGSRHHTGFPDLGQSCTLLCDHNIQTSEPQGFEPHSVAMPAWTACCVHEAPGSVRKHQCGAGSGTLTGFVLAQAPPGEARSVAAAVESIERAVDEALHDASSLPAPLPITAAALGVVPPRTPPASPPGPADAAMGSAADGAMARAAGRCAPVETAEEVVIFAEGEERQPQVRNAVDDCAWPVPWSRK